MTDRIKISCTLLKHPGNGNVLYLFLQLSQYTMLTYFTIRKGSLDGPLLPNKSGLRKHRVQRMSSYHLLTEAGVELHHRSLNGELPEMWMEEERK